MTSFSSPSRPRTSRNQGSPPSHVDDSNVRHQPPLSSEETVLKMFGVDIPPHTERVTQDITQPNKPSVPHALPNLPPLPQLPDLPQAEKPFETVMAEIEQLIESDHPMSKRQLMKLARDDWAVHAAFYQLDQVHEILDCLEELGLSSRERDKWLRLVNRKRKPVEAQIKKIEAIAAQRSAMERKIQTLRGNTLPLVILTNKQLREQADQVMRHLENHSTLYLFGDAIARVGANSQGVLQTYIMDENSLPLMLSRFMDFFEERKERYAPVPPPSQVIKAVLNHDQKKLPVLNGLTYTPVLTPQGNLHYTQGYEPTTKLVNAYPYEINRSVLEPTEEHLESAKRLLLLDLLGNAPLVSMADKANTIAMSLQTIVRPYIGDICPLYVLQAPTEGTGKTYLAECAAYTTQPATMNPIFRAPKTEDEWRKQITTYLQSSRPFMIFDNVDGYLDSPSLNSLLTTSTWADRILGMSVMVEIPVIQTFALTANNVRLHKDTLSRSVFINLDANLETPWQRQIERDIKTEIQLNRQPYTEALITLVTWWLNCGAPLREASSTISRFKKWETVMGSILDTCGIPGLCENMTEQASEKVVAWRGFTHWWWEKYGERETSASLLLAGASYHQDKPDEGKNILGQWIKSPTEKGRITKLGYELKWATNRVFGNLKVVHSQTTDYGSNLYRLIRAI